MKKIFLAYIIAIAALCALIAFAGYSTWNAADPEYTCAQCHEIKPTHEKWKDSSHAEVSCVVCHSPHSNSAAESCAKCHDTSVDKYKFTPGKCPQFAVSKQ